MNHASLIQTESRQCALYRRVPVVAVPESARSRLGANRLRARRVSEVAAVVDVAAAAGNPVRSACHRRGSAARRLIPRAAGRLALCVVHHRPLVQSVATEAAAADSTTVEGANILIQPKIIE